MGQLPALYFRSLISDHIEMFECLNYIYQKIRGYISEFVFIETYKHFNVNGSLIKDSETFETNLNVLNISKNI